MVLGGSVSKFNRLPLSNSLHLHKLVSNFLPLHVDLLTYGDILRVTGYLVYYRFVNLIIVTPMEFKVVDVRDLNVNTTKNLVAVAKVLQQLFYLSTFSEKCIFFSSTEQNYKYE